MKVPASLERGVRWGGVGGVEVRRSGGMMSHYKGKGKSKQKKEAPPKSPSNSHWNSQGEAEGEWIGGGARRGRGRELDYSSRRAIPLIMETAQTCD